MIIKNLTRTANVTEGRAMDMLIVPADKRKEYAEKLKIQPWCRIHFLCRGFFVSQKAHELQRSEVYEGRNSQIGAAIKIAASKIPAFKAGKALKDLVR